MGQKRGPRHKSISNQFNKMNKALSKRKKSLCRKWCWKKWMNISKKWTWTSTSALNQKLIWNSHRSNVTAKIITPVGENVEDYLHEFGVGKDFLHSSQEAITIKAKLDKLVFSKVLLSKATAKKWNGR